MMYNEDWNAIEYGTCVHCGASLNQYINIHTGEIEPLICDYGVCLMTPQERREFETGME